MVPESPGSAVLFNYDFPAKVAQGLDPTEEQLEEHNRVLKNLRRPEIDKLLFFPESWL